MENRERDRVSQRNSPTEAGEVNRQTEEKKGREQNSGTSAEFGQNIGRSENLNEGGSMDRNKMNEDRNQGKKMDIENETNRRSGSGEFDSSTGRSGSTEKESDSSISRDDLNKDKNLGNPRGDSSEGRH